jgi:hypothetical protein
MLDSQPSPFYLILGVLTPCSVLSSQLCKEHIICYATILFCLLRMKFDALLYLFDSIHYASDDVFEGSFHYIVCVFPSLHCTCHLTSG